MQVTLDVLGPYVRDNQPQCLYYLWRHTRMAYHRGRGNSGQHFSPPRKGNAHECRGWPLVRPVGRHSIHRGVHMSDDDDGRGTCGVKTGREGAEEYICQPAKYRKESLQLYIVCTGD